MSDFEWWQLIIALLTMAFGAWAWIVGRMGSQVSESIKQVRDGMDTAVNPLVRKIDSLQADIRHLTQAFQDHQLDVERRVTRLEAARDTSIPINNDGERRG